MAYSWLRAEFIEMRIAAVVVACVLSSAAVAWAADPVRATVGPAQAAMPGTAPGPVAARASPPATQSAPVASSPVAPAPAQGASPAAAGTLPEAAKRSEDPRPRVDAARRPEPPRRVCFGPAETREKIAAHRLAEPIKALRVGRQQGEALRARLCSWKADKFVYEVFVLRRDGRIVRVYMNAANGQAVGALSDSDLR